MVPCENPPLAFDMNDACDQTVEPHHVPVVSRQRSEVSNLSLRSHASILGTDSPHDAHQPSRIQNATGCVSWKIALPTKNSNLLSVRTRCHRIP